MVVFLTIQIQIRMQVSTKQPYYIRYF